LHGPLDLSIGGIWIYKDNEPHNGEEWAKKGLMAHQPLLSLAEYAELSN
jgi:hypothetical protein